MPKLELVYVKNHGKAADEYVLLRATQDLDLKYYMICDTTYTSDTSISNTFRHTYWFATQTVKSGEYVVLYTKKGSYSKTQNNGNVFHNYYWNSNAAIWNDDGDGAIVFEITNWRAKRAK